jgi:Holliday junction DNA helicase RuvB
MTHQVIAQPQFLGDFLGQPRAVEVLKDMIGSARSQESPVGHFLLYGGPGLGKTTLAQIVANEMGSLAHIKMAQDFKSPAELLCYINYHMKPKDILLLDEIHRIRKPVEESLFHYMVNRHVDMNIPLRFFPDSHRNGFIKANPKLKASDNIYVHGIGSAITIIGATTNPEALLGPFMDRFQSLVELKDYDIDDVCQIIRGICQKNSIGIDEEVIQAIAENCRSTIRVAHNIIQMCVDHLLSRGLPKTISMEAFSQVSKKHGFGPFGLRNKDKEYLQVLEERGLVGCSSIAKILGYRDTQVVEEMIEPYLMKKGWVDINNGRVLTNKGHGVIKEIMKWEGQD